MSKLFSQQLLEWHTKHGRHNLPWQIEKTPYRVWVSEIMLQQTQVTKVIPYFVRFIEAYPSPTAVALSQYDPVARLWAGLGYYRRVQYFWQSCCIIHDKYNGYVPTHPDILQQLPGIGRSTAHAIASISTNLAVPILDANVIRVLCRYHAFKEIPQKAASQRQLWQWAYTHMPTTQCSEYSQAIMDLGATVCSKTPQCSRCPLHTTCTGFKLGIAHTLPTTQSRRKRPTRQRYYLLLYHSSHLYLVKRPSKGVWPLLWCLPEFNTVSSLQLWLREHNYPSAHERGSIAHSFSHYHLTMHIFSIRVSSTTSLPIALDKLDLYPLPSPLASRLTYDIMIKIIDESYYECNTSKHLLLQTSA